MNIVDQATIDIFLADGLPTSSRNRIFHLLLDTGGPCNSRILGEIKIRELQNREFQGTPYLGVDVP